VADHSTDKKTHKKPQFFCVDVEASGPVPGLFNMVSMGCVAVDERSDGSFAPGEQLYLELRPVFSGIEPEAMRIAGLSLEHLRQNGQEPVEAMRALAQFVRASTRDGRRAVFVGHNAPFDWMMVCYYFVFTRIENPFGYSALDTKALSMGLFGLPWGETNKEVLPGLLSIADEDATQKHRADYDARFQAEILCGLLRKHREVARREGRGDAGP